MLSSAVVTTSWGVIMKFIRASRQCEPWLNVSITDATPDVSLISEKRLRRICNVTSGRK